MLRLTVALTRAPAEVSDELFESLRKQFSEGQFVELNSAISWENYRARFNRTLQSSPKDSQKDSTVHFLDGKVTPRRPEELHCDFTMLNVRSSTIYSAGRPAKN